MALEGTVEVEVDQPDTSTEVTEAEQGENVDINVAVTGDDEIMEPDAGIIVNPEAALKLDLENAYMSLDGTNWMKYGDGNHLYNEYSSVHIPNFIYEYAPGRYHWEIGSLGYYTSDTEYLRTGTAWLKIPAKVMSVGLITVNANLVDNERQGSNGREGLLLDEDTTTLTGIAAGGNTDSITTTEAATTNTAAATTNTIPMQKTGTPIIPAIIGLLSIIGGAMYTRLR